MEDLKIVDSISELDVFFQNLIIPEEEKIKVIKALDVLTSSVLRYDQALKTIAYDKTVRDFAKIVDLAAKALEETINKEKF